MSEPTEIAVGLTAWMAVGVIAGVALLVLSNRWAARHPDVDECGDEFCPARIGSWELDALVHVTPTGDELELPLIDGWDEDAILRTLEHIEAL